ncbi:MAG: hypothetical protein ACREQC_05440, partial [Candidatus Binataceae bacterium]
MKTFDVQSVEIKAPFDKAFAYIADPRRLPKWTAAFGTGRIGQYPAFRSVGDRRATMQTEAGSVAKPGLGHGDSDSFGAQRWQNPIGWWSGRPQRRYG